MSGNIYHDIENLVPLVHYNVEGNSATLTNFRDNRYAEKSSIFQIATFFLTCFIEEVRIADHSKD